MAEHFNKKDEEIANYLLLMVKLNKGKNIFDRVLKYLLWLAFSAIGIYLLITTVGWKPTIGVMLLILGNNVTLREDFSELLKQFVIKQNIEEIKKKHE